MATGKGDLKVCGKPLGRRRITKEPVFCGRTDEHDPSLCASAEAIEYVRNRPRRTRHDHD